MCYYPFLDRLDPIVVESSFIVLFLVDRTPVEVGWPVPLMRFRAFYTLVHEGNVENLNS
jgi:hypothetical protein